MHNFSVCATTIIEHIISTIYNFSRTKVRGSLLIDLREVEGSCSVHLLLNDDSVLDASNPYKPRDPTLCSKIDSNLQVLKIQAS